MSQGDAVDFEIVGKSPLSRHEIATAFERGGANSLAGVKGDFLIAHTDAHGAVTLVSGLDRRLPVYYAAGGPSEPVHGTDIRSIVARCGFEWQWDFIALADYLSVGHIVGERTLHAKVRTVRPGTVVTLRPGEEGIVDTGPLEFPERTRDPRNAIAALMFALASFDDRKLVLSMSGGLDSRLLLAGLLALGRRPRLVVSGVAGSFDLDVSLAIAERFGLNITHTAPTLQDIVETATRAAASSNGLLPISHWGGLAHLAMVGPAADVRVLLGSGGELARSYYVTSWEPGFMDAACDPRQSAAAILANRFRSPFSFKEAVLLPVELNYALEPSAIAERIAAALECGPTKETVSGYLDSFFLREHSRHKTGADLAALGGFEIDCSLPLLDTSVAMELERLSRRWKKGDRFHRHAIAELQPELVRFPEEQGGPVLRRAGAKDWWRKRPRPMRGLHFLDQSIFRSPELVKLLTDVGEHIGDVVPTELVSDLAREQITCCSRPNTLFSLMSLALWKVAAQG